MDTIAWGLFLGGLIIFATAAIWHVSKDWGKPNFWKK